MNLKKISLVITGLGILLNSSTQIPKRYTVAKPDTLVEALTEEETNEITHLVLQGKPNAIDFCHLQDEFKKLQILNISNASVSTYAGKNGMYPDRFYAYPTNCILSYAFCKQINDSVPTGKTPLTQVILFNRIKDVEDGIFKGCVDLRVRQIRKKTPPNLLPGALAGNVAAVFVPLDSSDAYQNGKRWEAFAFMEGEPMGVTVRIAAMSSLASELIHVGTQPKNVNFLVAERKMDEANFTLIRNYIPNLMNVGLFRCNTTVIPDYAFTQKKCLFNIKLPHGLRSIGQCAFSGRGRLYDILALSSGVTAIEYGVFMRCDNLRHILTTGNKITALGDNPFGSDKDKLVYRNW